MAVCVTCGNDYDKAFTIHTFEGKNLTFDSFECAIHALAPPGVYVIARSPPLPIPSTASRTATARRSRLPSRLCSPSRAGNCSS